MTLQDFMQQPFAKNIELISEASNLSSIPIEYISTIDSPLEEFVRANEIIMSSTTSVGTDSDTLFAFIHKLLNFPSRYYQIKTE